MMEKRTLLAFFLVFLVVVFYSWFLKPTSPPRVVPGTEGERKDAVEEAPVRREPPAEKAPALPAVRETLTRIETEEYSVDLSNIGGCIREVRLKNYLDRETQSPLVLASTELPQPGILSLLAPGGEIDFASVSYETIVEGKKVSYVYRAPALSLTKRFDFSNPNYNIGLEIEIKNNALQEQRLKYVIVGASGLKEAARGRDARIELNALVSGSMLREDLRKVKKRVLREGERQAGSIEWVGAKNQYFCLILKPFVKAAAIFSKVEAENLVAGIEPSPIFLSPGSTTKQSFLLYAGPLEEKRLAAFNSRLEEMINYGFFDPISKFILKTLNLFYRMVHNYGFAIIMLSLAIKLLFHPLTHISFKSMKAMQVLQPEIARIREEYKDNPQKMNKETMQLYKKHKVNPLGGCLPMLAQMPIFIALFQALSKAIELRGARFIFWMKDLSAPDEICRLPFSLPFLGDAVNVLPVLMALSMGFQQKLSMVEGAQSPQQKPMMIMMPVIFGVIFYNMPSGLVLYWLVTTIVSIAHQYFVVRTPHPIELNGRRKV